jgi:hypothetical protein
MFFKLLLKPLNRRFSAIILVKGKQSTQLLQQKLDKIYICTKCKMPFLFEADTEDHQLLWDHNEFSTWPLEVKKMT